MKKLVALLLAVMMMAAGMTAASAMTAGTYTAAAKGFGGDVIVTVEVSDSAILSVKAEGASETAGIGTNALEMLPTAIVEKQTLKLDAVAGCTVTSEAVLAAAADALRQSGATDDVIYAEAAATAAAEDEVMDVNVLVVGGGAAGLAAAMRANENGVENVVVIEKMPAIGGATAMAGGGMQGYIEFDDPAKTQESLEELFLYWCKTGKFTNNARLTMLAAKLSTPTAEWLKNIGVGITGGPKEGDITASYGCEGLAGTAIKTLYNKVVESGVPVLLNTKAEHLIMKDGRVVGVEATGDKGQKITINANAVLLATGGYGNNTSLISDTSILDRVIYYGNVGATGDGHTMMKEIGVPMFNMDKVATKHFGVETEPGFGIHIHMAVAPLFTQSGAIAVNKEGVRVVDEGGDELDIALASMYESSDGRLYIICDQASYDVFKAPLTKFFFSEEQLEGFIAENGSGITKLVKNDTLAGACEAIGLDPASVAATVADYNAGIAAGKEDPFKRGYTAPLSEEGPYYILQTVARYATTLGGCNVSDKMEVLDVNEQPVPGLYAAGEVVGNVNGSYAHYLIWCFGSGWEFGNVIAGK
ncbi:MAG: FAD-dependent oxidoreductase [Clostridia bacterium]|nr:FAD-dependent oxidoreductase [Clostridia bacterium]